MKLKITVPTSLKDITLRQYKHFLKVQEDITDEAFLNAKMIEIFCNLRLDEVMLLHLKDSLEITDAITKLFDEKPPLVTMFKLNGTEYGFQTNDGGRKMFETGVAIAISQSLEVV